MQVLLVLFQSPDVVFISTVYDIIIIINSMRTLFKIVQQFGNVSNENEIAFCVRLLNLTGLLIIGSINASRNAFKAIEKFMFISWLTIK